MEGGLPPDWNDLISEEEWAGMSEVAKQQILKIVSKEQESRRRLRSVRGGKPSLPVHKELNGAAESHGAGVGKRKSDGGSDVVGGGEGRDQDDQPHR
jgi:hypothetical protein